MAQDRSIEYNVPLTSFQHNQMKQGIYPAGRYKGFDTILNVGGGLNIQLANLGTGLQRVNDTNTYDVGDYGVVVMPTGVNIQTDDQPVLAIDDTAGGNRTDLIIMTHEFTQVPGGSSATISVMTGTAIVGSNFWPSPPAIGTAQAPKTVVLGRLYVKDTGASPRSFSDLIYVPEPQPTFDNVSLARTDNNRNYTDGLTSPVLTTITSSDFSGVDLYLPSKAEIYEVDVNAQTPLTRINHAAGEWSPDTEWVDGTVIKLVVKPGAGSLLITLDNSAGVNHRIRMGMGDDGGLRDGESTLEIFGSVTLKYIQSGYIGQPNWDIIDYQRNPDRALDIDTTINGVVSNYTLSSGQYDAAASNDYRMLYIYSGGTVTSPFDAWIRLDGQNIGRLRDVDSFSALVPKGEVLEVVHNGGTADIAIKEQIIKM